MRFSLLLLLWTLPCAAHIGYEEPWGKDSDLHYPTTASSSASATLSVRMAEKIIRFHQNVLSPVDGPRSHFYPSSSEYMRLAIQKYGFFKGFALGCNRLLRENDAAWVYRKIETAEGRILKYDPVP